jgi:hypothetical protein
VRDTAPEPPGPAHDALAVIAGLFLVKFLSIVVAEEIVWTGLALFGTEPGSESEEVAALVSDLILTFAFELFGLWAAWRLSRSRHVRVPAIVAGASLVLTFVHRWLLTDFGWALWYEAALLVLPGIALAVMWRGVRRQRVAVQPAP